MDVAYVRIRPTSQGFQQEAESGIRAGLRNVGSIVGGAFAAAGVFEAGKSIIEAAAAHQSAFAIVDQTLKNAHQSTDLYGVSVESLIEKEARLKGFHDEDLAQSFTRLVSATHDSAQAFKDLGLAEDTARARHLDVSIVALALARAEQGSTQSLSRLGVVIPKVNVELDNLKHRHDLAVAAGAKFNDQQKLIYKDALAQAAASDKVSNRLTALQTVQARFGGSATKFAQTASGQFQRAGQDIHQLEVAVGKDALPAITTLAEGVGHYAEQLTHSASVQDAVKAGMRDIGTVAHDLKDTVETIGPPLLAVAQGAADLAGAIGAPAILTAIGTYKALGIAATGVAAAETLYNKALLAGAAERVAATVEVGALTAAEEAQLVAATASAGGTRTLATGLVALATSGIGVGGIITLGVAALAGGLVYLATRETDTQRATDNFRSALGLLGNELNRTKQLEDELAQSKISVSLAKDAKAAADATLQQAVATERATRGTSQHAAAVLQLRTARDEDRQAALQVTQEEQRANAAASAESAHRKVLIADRAAELHTTLALVAAEDRRSQQLARGAFSGAVTGPARTAAVAGRAADLNAAAAIKIAATLRDEAQKLQDTNPGLATSLRLLSQYTTAIGRLPTKAETKFVLDPRNARLSLAQIERDLQTTAEVAVATARRGGHDIGVALSDGVRSGIADTQAKVSAGIAKSVTDTVAAGKAAAEAKSPSQATAREIGLPLAQGIAVGINTGSPEVQQALKDTVGQAISQGGQQVADAINQAKQNLNSIGSGLAATVGQFIDAGPLGAQIKRLQDMLTFRQTSQQRTQLRESVAAARKALAAAEDAVNTGGPVTPASRRAINEFLAQPRQQLAQAQAGLSDFNTQQRITALQARADRLKTSTARGIADLTDEFNKGTITAHRFNIGLAAILAKDDIDYRRAGSVLGVAYADGFEAQLVGLRDQMVALVGAPRLPGSGLVPSIVRPVDTLKQVTQQIAQAAQQQRAAALAEAKKHTKTLDKIAAQQKAAAFTQSLDKPPAPAGTGKPRR